MIHNQTSHSQTTPICGRQNNAGKLSVVLIPAAASPAVIRFGQTGRTGSGWKPRTFHSQPSELLEAEKKGNLKHVGSAGEKTDTSHSFIVKAGDLSYVFENNDNETAHGYSSFDSGAIMSVCFHDTEHSQ